MPTTMESKVNWSGHGTCVNETLPNLTIYLLESGFVVETVVIIINIYLAIAFTIHGVKCKMLTSKSKKDMHRGLVYKFAFLTVLLPFLRYTFTIVYIVAGRFCDGRMCEIASDVSYIGLMFSITATYTFLWIRQRVFYGHPSLCDRYGRCLVYFSKFVLIPIVAEGVIAVSVAVYPDEYTARHFKCTPINHGSDPKVLIYAALMVLTQTLLLGLFLHPVISHMKVQRRVTTNSGPGETNYSVDSSYTETSCSRYTTNNNVRRGSDMASKSCQSDNETRPSTDANLPTLEAISEDEHCEKQESPPTIEISTETEGLNQHVPVTEKPRSRSEPDLLRTAVKNSQNVLLERSTTIGGHSEGNWVSKEPIRTKSRSVMTTLKSKSQALKKKVRKTRSTVRSRGKVMKLIKRTVYLCIICILSDFAVSVINTVGWDAIPQAMQMVIYDVSLLINVITVIASFENFRKIIVLPFSCFFPQSKPPAKRSSRM